MTEENTNIWPTVKMTLLILVAILFFIASVCLAGFGLFALILGRSMADGWQMYVSCFTLSAVCLLIGLFIPYRPKETSSNKQPEKARNNPLKTVGTVLRVIEILFLFVVGGGLAFFEMLAGLNQGSLLFIPVVLIPLFLIIITFQAEKLSIFPFEIFFYIAAVIVLIASENETYSNSLFAIGAFLQIALFCYGKARKKAKNRKETPKTQDSEQIPNTSYQITPLLNAVLSGDLKLVQATLAEHPEMLNIAYAPNGNTPLHVAALNGHTEIMQFLLAQKDIDTTRKNNDGKTAFDLAASAGGTNFSN